MKACSYDGQAYYFRPLDRKFLQFNVDFHKIRLKSINEGLMIMDDSFNY